MQHVKKEHEALCINTDELPPPKSSEQSAVPQPPLPFSNIKRYNIWLGRALCSEQVRSYKYHIHLWHVLLLERGHGNYCHYSSFRLAHCEIFKFPKFPFMTAKKKNFTSKSKKDLIIMITVNIFFLYLSCPAAWHADIHSLFYLHHVSLLDMTGGEQWKKKWKESTNKRRYTKNSCRNNICNRNQCLVCVSPFTDSIQDLPCFLHTFVLIWLVDEVIRG